ncbi:MAG: hypothetical protein J6U70_07835 [Bacteroidales bacterium]|nr:hypothetical protein [Bacteroidales bacterium]
MHYFVVIALIIVIILLQIRSYLNTRSKIKSFNSIFPSQESAYRIKNVFVDTSKQLDCESEDDNPFSEDEDKVIEVSQLEVTSSSPVMGNIVKALNSYLAKNKGAASDFHLMKDVVERYCDAEEEEITTQQPIPLYLGLMGTMVGIIVGIGAIALTDGFTEGSLITHISELMSCVAIAMASSFTGVLCTTLIAWGSKNAVSKVQSHKNGFYSWIQTELLPVLSGDTINAIYLLQQNLVAFNQTFKANISGLDTALLKISDASKEQIELIQLIRDIDIRQVAQANIKVLKELKDCTSEMATFNQYLHNVSGYLNAVNALNQNINEHLNRTAAIERMGAFFESEIAQVSQREQYINQVVANVDDTLRKTFEALSDNVKSGVIELRGKAAEEYVDLTTSWEAQQNVFKETLAAQQVAMQELLQQRDREFTEYLKEQEATLAEKATVIHSMAKEIQLLGDTKIAMNDLVVSTREQNRKLDLLIEAISKNTTFLGNQSAAGGENKNDSISTIIKWGSLVCIMLIILGFGMYAYRFVKDFNPLSDDNISSENVVVPNSEVSSNVVDTLSVKDTAVLIIPN